MDMKKIFFIDFDSTFIQIESLEALAEISLKNNPQKKQIIEKIKNITNQGMNGEIDFGESLKKRIKLLNANKSHIEKTIKIVAKKITPSILTNKSFFEKNFANVYIITGGFRDMVWPIVKNFGITSDHVLANDFIYDEKQNIIGFDEKNRLSRQGGKAKIIKDLNLKGEIIMVGDGYTDYEVKLHKIAHKFGAFSENIARANVSKNADFNVPNFDELLYRFGFPTSISFPKNRIKVVLFEKIDDLAASIFKREGYSVEQYDKSFSGDELIEKIKDAHIIGIRSNTKITEQILEHTPKLMAIGTFCIGTDQTDLKVATEKGITVFNAPYSNTRSVVELIIGEIIVLSRDIFTKSNQVHDGIWDKSAKNNHEIRGKKLGIIGYGNIGSQLSVIAESMGMEVYFYDIVEKLALGNARRLSSMEELLKKSDFVTIHVDGRKSNANLIGEKEFKMMREGTIFLNASRGFIVDLIALAKYLSNGKIKSAAIDVFPKEPKSKDEKFINDLQKFPQVIMTPHIGGSTEEAQSNIANYVSNKIIDFINTGNTYLSVNYPNIQLPLQSNFHRLLHLHQNVPGILAQINGIMAKYKMNIEGQYLKTNENVGYAITDVNSKYDKSAIEELRHIDGTIRLRVLF
jgi:D-3-phosphoglycerate dehydrogenase